MSKPAINLLKRIDSYLLLSIILFIVLVSPFVGSIPYLDGNIDFVKGYDYYSGGVQKLLENWSSIHPPLKPIIASIFFLMVGINTYSFTLIGLILGILGIILFFNLTRIIGNIFIARVSTILFATTPIIIATSIFGLIDYMLLIFIIATFFAYARSSYLVYILASSFAVLTKETGLLLPVSVIVVEVMFLRRNIKGQNKKQFLITFLSLVIPLLIFWAWYLLLQSFGKHTWSDWVFAETASRGSFYTVLYNLITFNIFNKYAYQQWLQLIILNFNWIFWMVILIGFIIFTKGITVSKFIQKILTATASVKTLCAVSLFSLAYFLSVLSFQTYTIPRYALPFLPFFLIAASFSIEKLKLLNRNLAFFVLVILSVISIIRLFYSIDPISSLLWKKTEVMGQKIYAMNQTLADNDGITYNVQYLFIVKKRSNILNSLESSSLKHCYWLFPDPNNDAKTMIILDNSRMQAIYKQCFLD